MAQKMSYRKCVIPNCDTILPYYLPQCSKCGAQQLKVCSQCFYLIPIDAISCPYPFCVHIQNNPPRLRPCVLCGNWLGDHSKWDKCKWCSAPQDYSLLMKTNFKICCNVRCHWVMMMENTRCYRCREQQSTIDCNFISFDKIQGLNINLINHLKAAVAQPPPPPPPPPLSNPQLLVKKMTQKFEGLSQSQGKESPPVTSSTTHTVSHNDEEGKSERKKKETESKTGSNSNEKQDKLNNTVPSDKKASDGFADNYVHVNKVDKNSQDLPKTPDLQSAETHPLVDVERNNDPSKSTINNDGHGNGVSPHTTSSSSSGTVNTETLVDDTKPKEDHKNPPISSRQASMPKDTKPTKDDKNPTTTSDQKPTPNLNEANDLSNTNPQSHSSDTGKQQQAQHSSPSATSKPRVENFPKSILPMTKNLPPGFCTKKDPDQMCIIFRALVHKQEWDWNEKSKVCMRFGGQDFGDFKYDFVGDLERDDDMYACYKFHCYLKATSVRLQLYFKYKYTVFSNRAKEIDDVYEGLPEAKSGPTIVDRLLDIPYDKCQPKGRIYQFDTVIYPRIDSIESSASSSSAWLSGIKNLGKTALTSMGLMDSNDSNKERVENFDGMFHACLEFYLLPLKRSILIGACTNLPVETDEAVMAIKCLSYRKYFGVFNRAIDFVKEDAEVWIGKVLEDVESIEKESTQLYSALTTLVFITKLNNQRVMNLDKGVSLRIFKIIGTSYLKCFQEDSTMPALKELIEKENSRVIQAIKLALQTELKRLVDTVKKPENILILLKVLPCIFGKKPQSEFSAIDKELKLIPSLGSSVKNCDVGLIEFAVKEAQPLLQVHPLFSYTLLRLCPFKEFDMLCEYVELDVFIDVLIHNIPPNYSGVVDCIIKSLIAVRNKVLSGEIHGDIDSLIKKFEKVSNSLLAKTYGLTFIETKAYCIFCLVFIGMCCCKNSSFADVCVKSTSTYLQTWITKFIGDSKFGGYHSRQQKKECKLWSFIFNEAEISVLLDITPHVKDKWTFVLKNVLEYRVSRVEDDKIVDLLKEIDSQEEKSDFLVNIVMERTSYVLNSLFEKKEEKKLKNFLASGSKSKKIAELLGKLLTKRYSMTQAGISLDDLLNWNLWPGFLKLLVSLTNVSSQSAKEEWQVICAEALSTFQSVCLSVQKGEASIQTIRLLQSKRSQVADLCSILSGSDNSSFGATSMERFIAVRDKEYEYFLEFEKKLSNFCKHLTKVPVEMMDINLISRSKENDPIHSLCIHLGNEEFEIQCYSAAKPVFSCLTMFHVLTVQYPSIIFRQYWDNRVKEVASKCESSITFQDVVEMIWEPVYSSVSHFVLDLKASKITLAAIDKKLKYRFDGSPIEFSRDLKFLSSGLSICSSNHSKDISWVDSICEMIAAYWEICDYTDFAKVFLTYCKKLKLNGDFRLVETISEGIDSDNELSYIDPRLISACKFLKSFAQDRRIKDCFDVFVGCPKIVEWIRNLGDKKKSETGDVESNVNDLQNFVNIALATAAGGEGDLNTAKLINLRIIGSGFGPLIYNLPQDSGFEVLQKHCQNLWAILKQTAELPIIMRSCEEQIEWYKSVRETQGSVEKTSFGQMRNINKLGVYEVGSIRIGQLSSQSEAVCVRLRKPEDGMESLPQYKYTFEELRDLESKLVLITGNESPERKDVDRFLDTFHCVCRIADVLMQLQHYGNTHYIQWCLKFSCSMTDVYDLLAYQAKKMESDLSSWLKEVKDERDKFYELNYFTTPQLLVLSEELGLFEASDDRKATIKPSVMNLLYSISEDLSSKVVRDSLSQADLSQEPDVESTVVTDISSSANATVTSSIVDLSPVIEKKEKSESKSVVKPNEPQDETPDYPKPRLTLEDLTPDQRSYFYNIKESFGYHSLLILFGFERCAASETMMEDVSKWCLEHEVNFDFPEEDDDDSFSNESGESDTDDSITDNTIEDVPEPSKEPIASLVPTVTTDQLSLPVVRKDININTHHEGNENSENHAFEQLIEIFPQVPLDKNHPLVKELLELDFELETSIEAAQKFPNDVSHAIRYLEKTTIDDSPSATKEGKGTFEEEAEVVELQKMRIEVLDVTNRNYMSLSKLGKLLQHLADKFDAVVSRARGLPETIKPSECNLVVVPPESVLKTTLSIYMESSDNEVALPLPTHEEVLICTKKTTPEEVTLLWKRAFDDPGNKRIFCLVHAELLNYQVCDSALRDLQQLSQDKKGYKIVIICSNEEEEKSNIIAKLQSYRRPYQGIKADKSFLQYLMPFFVQPFEDQDGVLIKASSVDRERSRVRILSSTRAGMGKSFYIQKMAEALCQDGTDDNCYRVIPIHGPRVDADSLVKAFDAYLKYDTPDPCIYHIDVSQTVLRLMDTLLFNLLILQTMCDSKGRVWRVNSKDLYAIEVTIPQEKDIQEICRSTIDFIGILPSIECKSPLQVLKSYSDESDITDEKEFNKPAFQRVYQYLRRNEEQANLDKYSYSPEEAGILETQHSSECLKLLLDKFSVKDPSWSELRHFISFLNEQLERSEISVFCDSQFVHDIGLAGFKTFVVKFMIIMSRDFCTSSLKGEVAAETGKDTKDLGTMEMHQISEEKKWHRNYHPYLFFNKDGCSITFVGFTVTKSTGDVIDPVKGEVIMRRAIKRDLYEGLRNNRVDFDENYYNWNKYTMVEKIGTVMGIDNPVDPDPSYVLTPDNVIKILAIQMKFRCNIPVVIMGETGCGKTRLIRYMCDLAAQGGRKFSGSEKVTNMLIMKVHGGITPANITDMVLKAERKAEDNKNMYGIDTVLFFDEANTTDAIGLIKEVMCDRRLNGTALSSDLKFIAACNPYRKHHEDMIAKLESAGLGFYVKATEAQEKLGEIPLRQLVYRVFDLPPSMRPLIYDFGKLDDETEDKYTRQMVKDRCSTIKELASRGDVIEAVAHVLTRSQSYMKKRTDECSFVSLRDVERALIVFNYFFTKRHLFLDLIKEKIGVTKCVSRATWALIMSLSVCYHARLQDRNKYERKVVKMFNLKPALTEMEDGTYQSFTQLQFEEEIRWCQDVLLDHMTLGANIARNAALKENVFMMAICVQLKIPLFLVGKPGSSKSLAKSIIADSLNRQANEFLKDFNEVHMFSYQCSNLSTPESVIEVFNTARKFQEDQKNTKFTSVVVLDEVGLAEDSPNLPLKALHPLLEDGTEGTEDQQIIAREKRVAFIGISNWALDPAKMNRGVMVTRADPSCDELILSAKQICASDKALSQDPGTKSNDVLEALLEPYFTELSNAYTEICFTQIKIKRSFFGLRDFYSLIKMLFFMCKATKREPSDKQLEHAIKRNFGGFESDELDTYQTFEKHLRKIKCSAANKTAPDQEIDYELLNPDCSPLGLIEKSLRTKTDELSQMGESRYLLFLTENYAALQVLQYKLREAVGITKQEDSDVVDIEMSASGIGLEESSVVEKSVKPTTHRKKEPFVLFGSSFPKDREYTQVCRNINQIKICMETGRTVILLNLENLYESLYDLLNQYYILLGNSRYVDLGLQTHRVKCRVDNDFKLILIAEKETVYETFPTPLINRLEKHFVLTETILLDWQKKVLKKLRQWIEKFSQVKSYSSFKTEHAIVGYQKDTPAAVIFQVTKLKKEEWGIPNDSDLEYYSDEIQESSRELLLQMASPDALIRLKHTKLANEQKSLCRIYFEDQKHDCLTDFVKNQLSTEDNVSIQITTHSHLLSSLEIEEVYQTLGFTKQQVTFFLLQEFDTELDFTKALDPVFSESHHHQRLLIIQCDSGHLYGDLIASARYRIDDQREKAYRLGERKTGRTHVLLIVHLPRYAKAPRHDHSHKNFSFVGFQGGAWTSAHIDDIHVTEHSGITLNDAMSASISELFYSMPFNVPEHIDPVDTSEAYHSLVSAFTAEEKDLAENGEVEDKFETKQHTEEGGEVETDVESMESRTNESSEDIQLDEISEEHADKLLQKQAGGTPNGQSIIEQSDEGQQLNKAEFLETSGIEELHMKVDRMSDSNQEFDDDDDELMDTEAAFDMVPLGNAEDKVDSTAIEQSMDVQDIEEFGFEEEMNIDEEASKSESDHSDEAMSANDQENDTQVPDGKEDSEPELSTEVVDTTQEEEHVKKFLDLDRPVSDKAYTQCSRLHYCIQSVIAMIAERDETKRDWAAKRVKLLLEFIPEKVDYPIGIETFYGALVWRIVLLLKDREAIYGGHTDWVVEEACNATSLHSGGTFQNVLARKIDRVLIPLFANILAFADCYYNMEIIRNNDGSSLHRQLWLRLFNHPDICSFKHFYSATNDKKFSGGLQYTLKQDFKCNFPFFWVVQELIDAELIKLRGGLGKSMKDIHSYLHQVFITTPLAEALCIIPVDQIEAYCQYYLHDFLQTIHHPTHALRKEEIEVLDAVIYTVTRGSNLYYGNHLKSLLSRIIAVHVVYEFHQKEIMWLGQLTSILPGLLGKLKLMDVDGYNQEYIDIHLHAVQFALDDLELPLDPNTKKAFPERNLQLQRCQNIISSILEGTEPVPLAVELRHYWNYIRVIKLFVEHIALKYPDLIVFANRMKAGFGQKCDCSQLQTLKDIQTRLIALETKISNKEKKSKSKSSLKDIQKRCKAFLSEVISTIFFGEHYNQPKPELIAELIEMVFKEYKEASEATSQTGSSQSVPAMRSFLLQLLLEYNIDDVIKQLNDHIHKNRMVMEQEQGICLLCIQCLEDAIFKRSQSSLLKDRSDICIKLLKEGSDVMKSTADSEHLNVTIEYLEAVAKIRFVCFTVTEMLYTKTLPQTPIALSNTEQALVQLLHTLCEDSTINDEISGPGVFLLKHIARQHGMSFLGKVMSMEYTKWIIPAHLRITDHDQQSIMKHSDLFTGVYDEYHGFNECLTDAVLSNDLIKMDGKCQHLDTRGCISLILALYQVVTMSHGYPEGDPRRLVDELKTNLLSYVKKIRSLSRELMTVSEVLINCFHCDKLDTMQPSFDQGKMQNRLLTEVVVHTAAVFQARKDMFIFKPFVNLLTSPGTLKNSYLPTCPGSMLNDSVKAALGGAFNKCPKGHLYFIDKCGDLTKQHDCPECGIRVPILKVDQISKNDNKLSTQDQSFTGYIFGDPNTDQPRPTERNLTPPSCAILRVLMNACLTWTACTNETETGGLVELTKSKFHQKDLPAFFWGHLESSIRALSKLTRINLDDACLLIHLILKRISIEPYPNIDETKKEGNLKSEEDRAKWENSFSLVFINPIIDEIPGYLNKAKMAGSSKESQEHDPLHYAIYEKRAIPAKSVIPRLWTYRPRITMEAFFQELQLHYDAQNNPKYPILQCLSEHDLMLRATQYLPEIVKLRQLLFEMYHRKIDRVEASKITVVEFIDSLNSQSAKEKARRCFESTKEAWMLAKNNFPGYSRQYVTDEYKAKPWDIDTLPIVYIIPSLSGPGVCTSALLEGLVQAHNTFIENCQFLLEKSLNQKNIWAQRKIPVKHVQHCHLVEYRQQLLSMVLSHCRYTLNHGEEQQLTYEFDALEKRFVDQFVHGRPTIGLELPQFKYRQDAYSIANVKRTVPQQELTSRAKSEIINELKTAQSLRSTLDIVEIIMGFMASGQYGADMKLSVFVTKSLKMKDQFLSKKALEYCSMKHILCLWTILSVAMAKSLLQTGQEPFSGMNDAFIVPINKNSRNEADLNEFLKDSNVEEFLYHLLEFIEGFIKHSQHYVNATWSLIDCMVEYSEVFDKYKKVFPQCFTVGHAVSVWKQAAGFVKTKVADV